MPVDWRKWGTREAALEALVQNVKATARDALETATPYQSPEERARLKSADAEIGSAFELLKELLDQIENVQVRNAFYENLLLFATAAFEVGAYGTTSVTNYNFFTHVARRQAASRAGQKSGAKRRAKRKWVEPVEREIREITKKNPFLTLSQLTEKLFEPERRGRLPDVLPAFETLKGHINEMDVPFCRRGPSKTA